MKVYTLKTSKGEVLATSTTPVKHSITIPTKKPKKMEKVVFPESTAKSAYQVHLRRLAENYITAKKLAGITRRAKASSILKLKDGRKVFVKAITKQTKRSMMNPRPKTKAISAQGNKTTKAMMKIVEKLNVDRFNAYRKKQMEKDGTVAKFVPYPYKKPVDMKGFKGKYVAGPKPKRIVRVTNLPEGASEKQVQFALKRSGAYADKIKVSSFNAKDKDGKSKKETFALVYTKSEHDARALVRNRLQKMKVDGNKVGLKLQALHKAGPSKKKIAAVKKVTEERKKKINAQIQANHQRHMANVKRAARNKNKRRQPKFEKTRILRDPKSHRVYAIRKNKAAKSTKAERTKMTAYKKLRSMPRLTRK